MCIVQRQMHRDKAMLDFSHMYEVLVSEQMNVMYKVQSLGQMIEVVLIHLNRDQNYTSLFSVYINLETVRLEFVAQRF